MATTEKDSVLEHMDQLRVKMVQQKLANEKERILQRSPSEESNRDELENQARLQQAMMRRQELLDRIRRQQLMNEDTKRPRTYSAARRRYSPSPPPSRRSLPSLMRYNYPDTFRSKPPESWVKDVGNAIIEDHVKNEEQRPDDDVSQVKHVIQHTFEPKYNLPPIQNIPEPPPPIQYQPPPPQRPIVLAPPPPPQIMQQPQPQIIQAPPPAQIIATNPNPVVTHIGGPPSQPENKSMFNKNDANEMFLMQNAQMHQMVMQKMMLGQLQGSLGPYPYGYDGWNHGGHGRCCTANSCHGNCHGNCHGGCHGGCGGGCHDGCHDTHCIHVPRPSGAVHHHHYTAPQPQPQPEPVINTYTTVPMDVRYQPRGYNSLFTSPAYSTWQFEDPSPYPAFFTYH